jgi:hypothetical protein
MSAVHTGWKSATAQGLGVLLGILIAFSIDAAWEERADREREVGYTLALAAELADNKRTFEYSLTRIEGSVRVIDHYMGAVVFADGAIPPDTLASMLWVLGPIPPFAPQRAALEDILSSGGIAFVEAADLRRLISGYDQRLTQNKEARAAVIAIAANALGPYSAAHGSLVDMIPSDFGWPAAGQRGYFKPTQDAFVRNREFANLLTQRRLLYGRLAGSTTDLLSAIDTLASRLPAS